MRKLYLFFLILSISCIYETTFAQRETSVSQPSRAQNVFVELGGQGILITANYDTRFNKTRNGLGARAGIGYIAGSGDHFATIPVSLNYLLGKEKHFFEVGLGATLVTGSWNDSFFSNNTASHSNTIGTMSFAYRVQPVDSGFAFRAGLTPIFTSNFFFPFFGGLSIGYTF
jgi:hypothetical protein